MGMQQSPIQIREVDAAISPGVSRVIGGIGVDIRFPDGQFRTGTEGGLYRLRLGIIGVEYGGGRAVTTEKESTFPYLTSSLPPISDSNLESFICMGWVGGGGGDTREGDRGTKYIGG